MKYFVYFCKKELEFDINDNTSIQLASNDEILIYQSEDGTIKVDVLFQDETVWLTIDNMCLLFGKARSTINEHILNVFSEGELEEERSVRKIGISDFSTNPTNFYNLGAEIGCGYRKELFERGGNEGTEAHCRAVPGLCRSPS